MSNKIQIPAEHGIDDQGRAYVHTNMFGVSVLLQAGSGGTRMVTVRGDPDTRVGVSNDSPNKLWDDEDSGG